MTTEHENEARKQRGLVIAATCRLAKKADSVWLVPSQSSNSRYEVDAKAHTCSCPDFQTRGQPCKHLHAVTFTVQRELFDDGTVQETRTMTVSETVRRPATPRDWAAYNATQANEKHKFQVLLRDLLRGIPETDAPRRRGNQPFPVRDGLFAAIYKVYSTVSTRRFLSDMRDAHERGYVTQCPGKSTIFSVLEDESVSPLLQSLVVEAASPLKAIETNFACDSSGFSSSRFDKWLDHKHGNRQIRRAWCKCHVMCGVRTHVVTAVEILDQNAGDSPRLPSLLATTAQRFKVMEVSADLGYSSNANLHAIARAGAMPFIPFKCNAMAGQSRLWDHLFHYFHLHREEFLRHYHLRSNVESVFSMVKAKWGDGVRCRTDTAMKNEVLCKLLAHNIVCVIQSMYELGVNSEFWSGALSA